MNVSKPHIVAIDILSEGAVIAFQDNRTALFPAAFLYAALPQVQELFEPEPELTDEPEEDKSIFGMRIVR